MSLASATVSPVFTAADIAAMSAAERTYFADMPDAHIAAHDDFLHHLLVERRNLAAVRAHQSRQSSARRLAALAWGA